MAGSGFDPVAYAKQKKNPLGSNPLGVFSCDPVPPGRESEKGLFQKASPSPAGPNHKPARPHTPFKSIQLYLAGYGDIDIT